MAEYYNVVPWSNAKEWLDMCDKLHPTTTLECKKEALELLLVWKARCPFLPSGIESTLTLLEVIIKDAAISNAYDAAVDQLVRLAYSTAIMRFVNHMFDGETAKGTSLYQAAINLNVPSWVVDLRHDTAHSNTLPTLQLLRDGAEVCCSWLYEQYWLKHKPFISDYITTSDKVVREENEYKIGALINFCVTLSVCASAKSEIKNLADIPDLFMQESILNDLHELFGNTIDIAQMKTTSISSLINLINTHSKKLLQVKDAASHINKALLSDDSIILSLELLKQLNYNAIQHKRSLSSQYVQCFEVLLTFLHTNNLLQDFVLELIQLTQKDDVNHNRRRLAALWVAEIFKGLKKCKDFAEKMKNTKPDKYPKKRKDLKSLYHHWFPNDNNGLVLDLLKPVPHDLTNIHFIRPIISSYNPYLTYFIKNSLHIIQPQLPSTTINNICKLSDLIAFPDKFPTQASKIYTINDLKIHSFCKVEEAENEIDVIMVEQNESNETKDPHVSCQSSGIWKISVTNNHWSSCPIGVLPWQVGAEMNKDSKTMDTS